MLLRLQCWKPAEKRENILLVGCGNLGKIVLDGLLLENKKVYLLEKNQNITKN